MFKIQCIFCAQSALIQPGHISSVQCPVAGGYHIRWYGISKWSKVWTRMGTKPRRTEGKQELEWSFWLQLPASPNPYQVSSALNNKILCLSSEAEHRRKHCLCYAYGDRHGHLESLRASWTVMKSLIPWIFPFITPTGRVIWEPGVCRISLHSHRYLILIKNWINICWFGSQL